MFTAGLLSTMYDNPGPSAEEAEASEQGLGRKLLLHRFSSASDLSYSLP